MERHPADPISLVAGIVFAVVGALMLADRLDLLAQARWVVPLLVIAFAIAMLVTALPWRHHRADVNGETPEG
jgi:amino acid permease